MLLAWWYGVHTYVQGARYEEKITTEFDAQVKELINEMTTYDVDSFAYDLGSIETIPFEIKENVDDYLIWIREQFSTAVDTAIDNWSLSMRREIDISEHIAAMTTKEKIAQLFMFWIQWIWLTEQDKAFFDAYKPWWIILMQKNISQLTAWLTQNIQLTNNKTPLFVSIDQEWGPVKRVEEDLPWQQNVGLDNICEVYQTRADILEKLWINMNFWIVADVSTNKYSFIYDRVFPWDVSEYVSQAVSCTDKTLSTIKHYPWHWVVPWDSHRGVLTTRIECNWLESIHIPPFTTWVESGTDLVMMWHIKVPCVDSRLPASLSETHVKNLRDSWFEWLIITDDMDMIANDYNRKTSLQYALLAWNDIVLYVEDTVKRSQVMEAAFGYYDQWILTDEMIDTRLERILTKKNKIITMQKYIPLSLYRRSN